MAEFKISSLRFNYVGNWQTGETYNRDAVATYNGQTYVCQIPHTSTVFSEDLVNTGVISGASFTYWTILLPGHVWNNEWAPNTEYFTDNVVAFGGAVYHCTEAHTSGELFDPAKFQLLVEFSGWNTSWQPATSYGIGDVVRYGGTVYSCNNTHVSAETELLGLEADLSKWTIIYASIDYLGPWQAAQRYKERDVVKVGPDLYKCTVGHTSGAIFLENNWQLWLPGIEYVSTWSGSTVYQKGDTVIYGGYTFVSLSPNNLTNIPSVGSPFWDIISPNYEIQGEWNQSTSYKIGDVVSRRGQLFRAIIDNVGRNPSTSIPITKPLVLSGSTGTLLKFNSTSGLVRGMTVLGTSLDSGQSISRVQDVNTVVLSQQPDGLLTDGQDITFVGVNADYWELMVPGNNWLSKWQAGFTYTIGDIVVWRNGTYKCIQNHSAGEYNRPDADLTNDFWAIYILHSKGNALENLGDIVTFKDGKNSALPIGEDTNTLQTNGTSLSWNKILVTDKVYYVSTTSGQDRADWGTTWDQPWKTIRYACEKAAQGSQYPKASALLKANTEWMVSEMYQWMLYQKSQSSAPFSPTSEFDQEKTLRDARYIVNAIIYDLTRVGNSQTVAATTAYFKPETTDTFFSDAVTEQMPYFVAALSYLGTLIDCALTSTSPTFSYQALNGVTEIITQVTDLPGSEINATQASSVLLSIVTTALTNKSTKSIPPANSGISTTINVKTGTYEETLPIVVPENTAIVGDELRSVVVRPKIAISTLVSAAAIDGSNLFTAVTTEDMYDQCPVQFVATNTDSPLVLKQFETTTIVPGQTYFVIGSSITPTKFAVSETPGGPAVSLIGSVGLMEVIGGDAILDMFRMRNASGLRNMSLVGKLGTLTEQNEWGTQRPTGNSYVSLDPGAGPDDTSAWIVRRSPYIQNVSTFGKGCVGAKIDGTLHNGGNKSIVANDFTQILSDGIGVWCTGTGSLTELISVFTYYNYASYFAENGGKIRAANGNSSYGVYGVVAEGYDPTEIPISGTVFNRSGRASASVQSSYGMNANLLKFQYSNAGSDYTQTATNLLLQSNNFSTTWLTDDHLILQKNIVGPFGNNDGWTITSMDTVADHGILYQSIGIVPAGGVYSGVPGSTVGGGSGATFTITVSATGYNITAITGSPAGGSGYVVGNTITILGNLLGGVSGVNDAVITVTGLTGSSIATATISGTVPSNVLQKYAASLYVKQDTSPSVDLYLEFSGVSTVSSSIHFNFINNTVTPESHSGGITPVDYGVDMLGDGWSRIWFSAIDPTGRNTSLKYKFYPRPQTGGISGRTQIYGAQLENRSTPSFYLTTTTRHDTAYADYIINGAGSNAVVIGDEIRSNGVFQVRVLDTGTGAGGAGYLTSSNQAQNGGENFITLSNADANTSTAYSGMRIMVTSGMGAGQYGMISYYDTLTKMAYIAKESIPFALITSAASASNLFTLDPSVDINTLYLNQPVQFFPTYYTTTTTSISQDKLIVTSAIGGTTNTLTTSSTNRLSINMPVTFTGTVFGGVITDFTYYISNIIDNTTFQISSVIYGSVLPLNTASGSMEINIETNTGYLYASSTANMVPNMPIVFNGTPFGGLTNGTTYYVNDVISSNYFTISNSLITTQASATSSANDQITINPSTLVILNPIVFSGAVIGGLVAGQKYYISSIVDNTHIKVSSNIVTTTVTQTTSVSNLITTTSTANLTPNTPIKFVGYSFGGIVAEQVYYVLAVQDSTHFTISVLPGGAAVSLTSATGYMTTHSPGAAVTLTDSSGGNMTCTTTIAKNMALNSSIGSLSSVYYTEISGGVTPGTTYYILAINSGSTNTVSITNTSGGTTPVNLTNSGTSMQMVTSGWDHVTPGTPTVTLDGTSVYYIEPRSIFTKPPFNQTTKVLPAQASTLGNIGYGNNYFILVPNGNSTLVGSSDTTSWENITLPISGNWAGIAYGNGYWVLTTNNSTTCLYTTTPAAGWKTSSGMPSTGNWKKIVYSNNKFVAIDATAGSSKAAYSTTYGSSWSASTLPATANWVGLAVGGDTYVAISDTGLVAYSTDGITWSSATLPGSVTTWKDISYGHGRFVAVSSSSASPAYSFDGITWYSSPYSVAATSIAYGQGVFVAIKSGSTTAYTSDDGIVWTTRVITNSNYNAITFGYTSNSKNGLFITVAGTATGSAISAGSVAKGRPVINSGVIGSYNIWSPGSGYTSGASLSFFDLNVTKSVETQVRVSNGVLANPTFLNRGTGYNTTSTAIIINGSGYADNYQSSLNLVVNNLTKQPAPGDDLVIDGISGIFKVTSAVVMKGTTAPALQATLAISPALTTSTSPNNGTTFTIREKYSQARLTNHDFLNVGYGDTYESGYPEAPLTTELMPQNQTIENNYGRVFYSSTDQDGNFKVGNLFGVQQATGIVTISATQFGLAGLTTLSLGGITVGASGVLITQFSTDPTFIANSDNIIPTQRAIKTYLASRLSQGGSNTVTGQLTSGTVVVGGINKIGSTVAEGTPGSVVKVTNTMNFVGPNAAVDGDEAAMLYFIKGFFHR